VNNDLLDAILREAMRQAYRPKQRRRQKPPDEPDYSQRLAEKALYRKLIDQSDIAQDGMRFVAYFSLPAHSEGKSLAEWRRRIDQEIRNAHQRKNHHQS
jgi:hypothetical protein